VVSTPQIVEAMPDSRVVADKITIEQDTWTEFLAALRAVA